MTRQQRWAKGAFEKVKAARGKPDEQRYRYRSRCFETPILIRQSGLVQAIAFLLRVKGNHPFVNDMASVLGAGDGARLQRVAQEAPLSDYLALTRDAIAVSVWFRRFAQSELEPEAKAATP